ncbi:unnamed protein product [Caenorhabditis auriculariae]|uniref:Uncharacterized protein n=1 Tax=Caenorhabditis auriculariae TaxID=2777116 RepID=A0A8S1HDC3_9PELO|nr:unnamed protein product [Caenorhabditis auriculariae]
MDYYHEHHKKGPFVVAFLLILVTILTGVATFTNYWATLSVFGANAGHMGLYAWFKSGANDAFNAQPGWWKCTVVTMLMAFSFELLFCILVIPSILFRKHIHGHALNALLSIIIAILLFVGIITFAVKVGSFNVAGISVPLKLGWSWGVGVAAAVVSIILILASSGSAYGAARSHYY